MIGGGRWPLASTETGPDEELLTAAKAPVPAIAIARTAVVAARSARRLCGAGVLIRPSQDTRRRPPGSGTEVSSPVGARRLPKPRVRYALGYARLGVQSAASETRRQ